MFEFIVGAACLVYLFMTVPGLVVIGLGLAALGVATLLTVVFWEVVAPILGGMIVLFAFSAAFVYAGNLVTWLKKPFTK